ncbi:very short patch repair endonuclease [Tsukamurella pseudospumae]|uniref:Very short patch repair endonuclease n=1 Tax=Tsukamurella pseudospumae TaxID=239498 RepID=A0A138AU00_9ACTN|nr:very short patch repair endonuclease [Tsukamurella pseudospumae]KXP13893.1 very short patch repair endonuclease [Tsukamurella pseudospumae]
MRSNRRKDTLPELAVRRLLHAAGMRYRVDFAPSASNRRRRADVVFTRARVVVFIDGCFWHGCPQHFRAPSTRTAYWGPKIAVNRARDDDTDAMLTAEGWTVLRFWAHEQAADVAASIIEAVRSRQ